MFKKIIEMITRAVDTWEFIIILGVLTVVVAIWSAYMGLAL